MLEHDCDTDEDCEVYFLKPVNEYNIVDKIKEANKELFDEGDSADSPPEQRRKVKFRVELEEYEPNPGADDGAANAADNDDDDAGCYEVLTLDDDVEDGGLPSDRTISTIEECAEMLALEVQKKIEAIEIKMPESEDEVEEICEEIVVMDMDTGRKLEEDTKEINSTKSSDDSPQNTPAEEDASEAPEEDEEEEEDDDEDDKLSIIVASYLPKDPPLSEENDSGKKSKSPFSRHFSFRRKNGKLNCHSPEITNIKLNYKTCCEYRDSERCKLPKYSGYMSEYGLSREQMEKREHALQNRHKVVTEKCLKASEAEVRKMQDNERAFTTWLKNKMRFPINRTKNMFDVKKANNCIGSGKSGIFRQK